MFKLCTPRRESIIYVFNYFLLCVTTLVWGCCKEVEVWKHLTRRDGIGWVGCESGEKNVPSPDNHRNSRFRYFFWLISRTSWLDRFFWYVSSGCMLWDWGGKSTTSDVCNWPSIVSFPLLLTSSFPMPQLLRDAVTTMVPWYQVMITKKATKGERGVGQEAFPQTKVDERETELAPFVLSNSTVNSRSFFF